MIEAAGRGREEGFTLLELVVSLAVVMTVMASVGTFFVGAMRTVHLQGEQQTAARYGLDGLEKARMLRGSALVAGRSVCLSASCPDAALNGAATAVGTSWQGRFDVGTAAARLAPPAYPETLTLDGVTFERRFYVRQCWAPKTGGGTCAETKSTASPAPYFRVVVSVAWRNNSCLAGRCSFVSATLFTGSLSDPVFRTAP